MESITRTKSSYGDNQEEFVVYNFTDADTVEKPGEEFWKYLIKINVYDNFIFQF